MNKLEKIKRLGIEEFLEWLSETDKGIYTVFYSDFIKHDGYRLLESFFKSFQPSSMTDRVKKSGHTDLMMGER